MLDQYFVILENGEWKVSHDQKSDGPYASQRAAITAAVARARMAAKRGKRSQVMVQDEKSGFREEWSHNRDHYASRDQTMGASRNARRN
jgi:hypothetical protein